MAKTAAWQRKEGKNPTGGLNAKGVASYRRERIQEVNLRWLLQLNLLN